MKNETFSQATLTPLATGCICFHQETVFEFCNSSRVWSGKKKKLQEGDINLPGSRWDVTENGDLRGSQANGSEGGKQTSV